MSKYGFTIKPNNKKLLKSSKVRKYFKEVEERIYLHLLAQDIIPTLMYPPIKWFTMKGKK